VREGIDAISMWCQGKLLTSTELANAFSVKFQTAPVRVNTNACQAGPLRYFPLLPSCHGSNLPFLNFTTK